MLLCLSAEELEAVRAASLAAGASDAVVTKHHALGGAGAIDLAEAVVKACSGAKPDFKYLYEVDLSIKVSTSCDLLLLHILAPNHLCSKAFVTRLHFLI